MEQLLILSTGIILFGLGLFGLIIDTTLNHIKNELKIQTKLMKEK